MPRHGCRPGGSRGYSHTSTRYSHSSSSSSEGQWRRGGAGEVHLAAALGTRPLQPHSTRPLLPLQPHSTRPQSRSSQHTGGSLHGKSTGRPGRTGPGSDPSCTQPPYHMGQHHSPQPRPLPSFLQHQPTLLLPQCSRTVYPRPRLRPPPLPLPQPASHTQARSTWPPFSSQVPATLHPQRAANQLPSTPAGQPPPPLALIRVRVPQKRGRQRL